MALDKSFIGLESEAELFEVERGAIRKFAEAIGDPNPVYQRGEVAPPTFPTTFRVKIPGLADVDPARFIHANEEYVYERPLRAGDRVLCRRKIVDLFEKEGRLGRMTFVVATLEGRDPSGSLIFTGKSTVIIHGGGKA
ncbi:MAG: FAS1-like dehydratase domain-containing protein [Bacillota bacterium]